MHNAKVPAGSNAAEGPDPAVTHGQRHSSVLQAKQVNTMELYTWPLS